MDAKQRFLNTMRGKQADRPPLFNEGIRGDVLEQWKREGYLRDKSLELMFKYDRREEISLELTTGFDLSSLAKKRNGLEIFQDFLNSKEESSMPSGWLENVKAWSIMYVEYIFFALCFSILTIFSDFFTFLEIF